MFKSQSLKSVSYELIEFMNNKSDWYGKIYHINEFDDEIVDGYILYPDTPEIARDIYNLYYNLKDIPKNKVEEYQKLIFYFVWS